MVVLPHGLSKVSARWLRLALVALRVRAGRRFAKPAGGRQPQMWSESFHLLPAARASEGVYEQRVVPCPTLAGRHGFLLACGHPTAQFISHPLGGTS